MHKCASARDARQIAERRVLDLVIVDPLGGDAEMRFFIPWLRRNEATSNRFAQCIIATGHTRQAEVSSARDSGANYVVVKPLSPKLLIDRLAWMSDDPRGFVSTPAYAGPDRRFRFDGPPAGSNGRRYDDQTLVVSEFAKPNLSQEAVDAMMKPRRISI